VVQASYLLCFPVDFVNLHLPTIEKSYYPPAFSPELHNEFILHTFSASSFLSLNVPDFYINKAVSVGFNSLFPEMELRSLSQNLSNRGSAVLISLFNNALTDFT